jgi:hypothetical protein
MNWQPTKDKTEYRAGQGELLVARICLPNERNKYYWAAVYPVGGADQYSSHKSLEQAQAWAKEILEPSGEETPE